MVTRRGLQGALPRVVIGVLIGALGLSGCKGREQQLAKCMDARLSASAAWEQYNATLRRAREQAQRTGGSLEVSMADPPNNPLAMAVYSRSFEGIAGIASVELGNAKSSTDQMWQSCRDLCEDMMCSGVVARERGDDNR